MGAGRFGFVFAGLLLWIAATDVGMTDDFIPG
jgi:hypothetical protein